MKKSECFIQNIDMRGGIVTYNDFDIDESKPFDQQKYSYKEDMLQVTFGDRFILDVGWLPEHDPKGYFVTQVVQDYDWMNPISRVKSYSLDELKQAIEAGIVKINEMRKIKDLPNRNPFRDEEMS